MGPYYQNEHQIKLVVRGFENCTTSKDAFKHRDHLTVAVWYLRNSDPEQALGKMRGGLLRFLDHHGIGRAKYKENLTVGWMSLVRTSLESLDPESTLLETTNMIINRLADTDLIPSNDSE